VLFEKSKVPSQCKKCKTLCNIPFFITVFSEAHC